MRYKFILLFIVCSSIQSFAQISLRDEMPPGYLEKLVDVARKNYPKVKMYQARVEMSDYNIKKTKLSYFDILSFSYLYSPSQTSATINPNFLQGYQFGFFANVGGLLQKPSLIRQIKKERESLVFEKETYDLNLDAEVRKRYYNYVSFMVLYRVKSNTLMDLESALVDTKHKFEKGEALLIDYNNALKVVSDQQVIKIMAETDLLISKSNLEELLGDKLENIK